MEWFGRRGDEPAIIQEQNYIQVKMPVSCRDKDVFCEIRTKFTRESQ
jgi:hypothetical protein